ncbi:Transcription initiation factor IIF subunit alpha [Wickerhamiella sorbophila]|uniref:Transcription initiation factor IIF subunit alpha n=1 Tax=Wickerhamiella sorbophila TaxID=45607 RepID=A0A2T0FM35_9ASCO|nr:Transcription initiation factor IIF subunit alpha [Wickerhamiella sorbophila]PRT56039.1 Transcription initiation factor IIF subunit alpha [Wickerhamiella sorbophila]
MTGKRKFESSDPLRRSTQRRIPPGVLNRSTQVGSGASTFIAGPAGGPGGSGGISQQPFSSQPSTAAPGFVAGAPTEINANQNYVPMAQPQIGQGEPMVGIQGPSSSSLPDAPGEKYDEFPLRCCTIDDVRDSRYHMIKFHSRSKIDPATQFTPPIRFHRKDPKLLQVTVGDEVSAGAEGSNPGSVDGENGAASSQGGENGEKPKKSGPFRRKKTYQAQGGDEASEAARKLRYEEHYPWVMEDFDNKNTWVSSYEAGQSDTYVVFVFDRDGFKMIPIEKFYRLNQRSKFATLSLDEAEEKMGKRNSNIPRWIMDKLQTERGAAGPGAEAIAAGHQRRRLRTVEGSEERTNRRSGLEEEMDFDEEFADDDGAPIMDGPEEDLKEVEDRIKREQRQANALDADDNDLDALFEDGEDQIDRNGKKLRKYLRALEKNAYYDSGDDENPYLSEEEADSEPEIKPDPDAASTSAGNGQTPLVVLPFRRKVIKNRLPGMAVIQLPPRILKTFPVGELNPGVKPYDGVDRKAVSVANSASASSTNLAALNKTSKSDEDGLLQADDVRKCLMDQRPTIKELLSTLRQKLFQHPDNQARLKRILREIATLQDGRLVLTS